MANDNDVWVDNGRTYGTQGESDKSILSDLFGIPDDED